MRRGYTLIELLVVIAVIGIEAAIIFCGPFFDKQYGGLTIQQWGIALATAAVSGIIINVWLVRARPRRARDSEDK